MTNNTNTNRSANVQRLEVLKDLAYAMDTELSALGFVNSNAGWNGDFMSEYERDVVASVQRSLERVRELCGSLERKIEQE